MTKTEKLLKIIRDMDKKMGEVVDNYREKPSKEDLIEKYIREMWQAQAAPIYVTYSTSTTPTYTTYTTYTTDTTNWRG